MEKPQFLTTLCRFLLPQYLLNNQQGEVVILLRRRLGKASVFSPFFTVQAFIILWLLSYVNLSSHRFFPSV